MMPASVAMASFEGRMFAYADFFQTPLLLGGVVGNLVFGKPRQCATDQDFAVTVTPFSAFGFQVAANQDFARTAFSDTLAVTVQAVLVAAYRRYVGAFEFAFGTAAFLSALLVETEDQIGSVSAHVAVFAVNVAFGLAGKGVGSLAAAVGQIFFGAQTGVQVVQFLNGNLPASGCFNPCAAVFQALGPAFGLMALVQTAADMQCAFAADQAGDAAGLYLAVFNPAKAAAGVAYAAHADVQAFAGGNHGGLVFAVCACFFAVVQAAAAQGETAAVDAAAADVVQGSRGINAGQAVAVDQAAVVHGVGANTGIAAGNQFAFGAVVDMAGADVQCLTAGQTVAVADAAAAFDAECAAGFDAAAAVKVGAEFESGVAAGGQGAAAVQPVGRQFEILAGQNAAAAAGNIAGGQFQAAGSGDFALLVVQTV